MPVLLALVAALPWLLTPVLLLVRLRTTPSLDDVADEPPARGVAPRVSVILPARNEAVHIEACMRSIRASSWPDLELVVVDDHSTDGTGAIARRVADGDPRVVVIDAPDLPPGWFGKQWACETGARHASGSLLLFTDADTRHAPDLVTRLVRLRDERRAELMSVAGRQDMGTIWEQAVQPTVFSLILLRYGGARAIESARRRADVVANGQCFLLSRDGYERIGRHEAVRDFVAEDVMIAQAVHASGRRVSLALGVGQLRTRMYDGLASLMRGWGKNVYAGGRFAMRGGAVGRALYPLLLLSFPLALLAPFMALVAALALRAGGVGDTGPWFVWGAIGAAGVLATFVGANVLNRDPWWRALLAPLGAAILLAICVLAIGRGRHVSWKGRGYVAR